jgi:DNA-binding NarL/FixJ family response regulator
MRLRPAHTRSRELTGTAESRSDRSLAVALVGHDPSSEARVRTVASTTSSFELVEILQPDAWGQVEELPNETDVVVVSLTDGARSLATLRELRRSNPGWRLVVVAPDTAWFEEAFELGADAWVDQSADDRTIELAVTGARFVREQKRRLSR